MTELDTTTPSDPPMGGRPPARVRFAGGWVVDVEDWHLTESGTGGGASGPTYSRLSGTIARGTDLPYAHGVLASVHLAEGMALDCCGRSAGAVVSRPLDGERDHLTIAFVACPLAAVRTDQVLPADSLPCPLCQGGPDGTTPVYAICAAERERNAAVTPEDWARLAELHRGP